MVNCVSQLQRVFGFGYARG